MIDKEKIKCKDSKDIRGIIEDLDTLGLYNPWNTVFCDLSHSPYFALFWIVFIIATIPKIYLFVNGNTNAMLKRIGNRSSGLLMVYGFATIFRQYNPALMKTFVDYYSVYIKSCVENLARYGKFEQLTKHNTNAINSIQSETGDDIRFGGLHKILENIPVGDKVFANRE